MSGLTITAERKKSVNFANPYYIESQYVLTLESNVKLDDCMTVIDVLNVLTANK
jgi:ABC-type amino acid transport substrate-binding protein